MYLSDVEPQQLPNKYTSIGVHWAQSCKPCTVRIVMYTTRMQDTEVTALYELLHKCPNVRQCEVQSIWR